MIQARRLLLALEGPNRAIVTNASALVGTTVVNSAFGFLYWWVAARQYPPDAVGLAAAAIASMTLLGTLGVVGVGTFLLGELPLRPADARSLITTGLWLAGTVSGLLSILFALIIPIVSGELEPLVHGYGGAALFTVGVVLTAVTLVLDQALIGLLRGRLQLWRNGVFAVAKLAGLLIVGVGLSDRSASIIYATWVIGNLVSLSIVLGVAVSEKARKWPWFPHWETLRGLGRASMEHHVLNLALQGPGLVLPILVAGLLSPKMNASFYVAWMMAGFAFVAPGALTTVLYAVGAADPLVLAKKIRFTLGFSLIAGLLVGGMMLLAAGQMLRLFGDVYADQAESSLRVLTLAIFPVIVKVHYVAVCRIHGRVVHAAKFMLAASILEVTAAAVGAQIGGLVGLSLGWLLVGYVEVPFMVGAVYEACAVSACPTGTSNTGSPRVHRSLREVPLGGDLLARLLRRRGE